jgi:hypothetical protein
MKRCKQCNKLADNAEKYCQRCGTEFEYDRWRMFFSETRIFLMIVILSLLGLAIYNAIPLLPPDPAECSQTSVNRFERIANNYYKETRNILRKEMLLSKELSTLRSLKNQADAIPVHPCLEPAKADLVDYLNEVYYIGVFSTGFAYQGAASRTERAGYYWDSLNTHLDELEACLPNCP